MPLRRIFLRDAHGVQVEHIIVAFSVPDDGLIAAGKTLRAMQAMFEVPNNPIPHFHFQTRKNRIKHGVERDNLPFEHIVAYLPAQAARRSQDAMAFANNLFLLLQVQLQVETLFVFLANVIGRGADDQLHACVGHSRKQIHAIARKYNRAPIHGESFMHDKFVLPKRQIAHHANVSRKIALTPS
ncbi:MAG: hypothetical protein BWZ10_01437 [candidate division BRC1 bacterium ADurb.BinA364]|nr:MAG: hypothetical protein BWZ10_01437 [candidate division BRC1 bacterium ADurb.BinA364]